MAIDPINDQKPNLVIPQEKMTPVDQGGLDQEKSSIPWGLGESLGVVAIFVAFQLGIAFLLGRVTFPQSATDIVVLLSITMALSHGVGWLLLWTVLHRKYRLSFFSVLGLGRLPRGLVAIFFGGLGLQILAALVSSVFPPPPDFESPFGVFADAGEVGLISLGVMAVIMAPLLEEALFRGLLYPAMRKRHGIPFSLFVVTVLFTSLHASQTGTYWPAIVGIAFCGLVLGWLRERTNSLWPSVFFHAGFNATALLAMVVAVSAGIKPG